MSCKFRLHLVECGKKEEILKGLFPRGQYIAVANWNIHGILHASSGRLVTGLGAGSHPTYRACKSREGGAPRDK